MILFDKDIAEQGAMIDIHTNNQSFLRMAVQLKRMGIKNNKFFLALLHPELQGLDPWSITDPVLQKKVGIECKLNPWYFLREVVRVPAQGTGGIRYQLNRANLALSWLFFCAINIFLTLPRQIGKTIGTQALVAWWIYFAATNTNVALFAKDSTLVLENVDRLKTIRDEIPGYLILKQSADSDNKEGLSYAAFENQYLTFVAQKDKRAAQGLGRGPTISVQHWDEFAYFSNNDLSFGSALASTDTASEQARAFGLPACNIITTTAGDLSDPAGRYAFEIKSGCVRFTETFYDCPNHDVLTKRIDENSSNGMVYVEYNYKQLGKDDAWFKKVTRLKTQVEIAKDYLCQWQFGSANPVVPKHLLDQLVANTREPFTTEWVDGMCINWYVDPDLVKGAFKQKPYVIGSDTSDNIGRDFTTMVCLDPDDMSIVFTMRCNLVNPLHIINFLTSLMIDVLPRSVLIMERNKNGATILDLLIETFRQKRINPFQRLYNTYIQNFSNTSQSLSTLDLSSGLTRKHFGYATAGGLNSSRDVLYKQILIRMVELCIKRIPDATLVSEIQGLVIKNGRIDHTDNGHDDELISYMLAGYFILMGNHLNMYTIQSNEIMGRIDSQGNDIDPIQKQMQDGLREKIAKLQELIEGTTSQMIKLSLQRELRQLREQLPETDEEKEALTAQQYKEAVKENSGAIKYNTMIQNYSQYMF